MKHRKTLILFILILAVALAIGGWLVSSNRIPTSRAAKPLYGKFSLSAAEKDTLRTSFTSDEQKAYEVGMICLKHRLSRGEIMELIGYTHMQSTNRETGGTGLSYPFAPSELLGFCFDRQDNLVEAQMTGANFPSLEALAANVMQVPASRGETSESTKPSAVPIPTPAIGTETFHARAPVELLSLRLPPSEESRRPKETSSLRKFGISSLTPAEIDFLQRARGKQGLAQKAFRIGKIALLHRLTAQECLQLVGLPEFPEYVPGKLEFQIAASEIMDLTFDKHGDIVSFGYDNRRYSLYESPNGLKVVPASLSSADRDALLSPLHETNALNIAQICLRLGLDATEIPEFLGKPTETKGDPHGGSPSSLVYMLGEGRKLEFQIFGWDSVESFEMDGQKHKRELGPESEP